MMTDDQIIEVVRAHRDGKIIQWCNADKNDWADYQICCFKDSGLNFDFIHYDYRIKPESKLRPYRDAKEFLNAQKEQGPYIKTLEHGYQIIISVFNSGIAYVNSEGCIKFSDLSESYTWQDDTPCGIIEAV